MNDIYQITVNGRDTSTQVQAKNVNHAIEVYLASKGIKPYNVGAYRRYIAIDGGYQEVDYNAIDADYRRYA